ncbi:MAG: ABC transporter permease, partial [Candidatus Omnitrophica bacterium]|nr:ABC transporter permease [Candidatus Omnitrophota bacterium]MBU1894298.1 ABC transporter permease [Candidatus Omnitrophota bacterium]
MSAIFAITGAMIKELIRKKDFYVLSILLMCFLLFLSTQNFFQVEGISRYIKDLGYSVMTFFAFIIVVIFTAKQLPTEIESRTIYPLLAKPLSRHTLILSKFVGSVVIAVSAYSIFFCVFVAFCVFKNVGVNNVLLLQAFLFGILFLCLTSAVVIFLSTFVTMAANVTISFLLYFLIVGFEDVLYTAMVYSKGAKEAMCVALYYIIPHMDFYDLRLRIA